MLCSWISSYIIHNVVVQVSDMCVYQAKYVCLYNEY